MSDWTAVNMTEDPRDPKFTIEEGDRLLATAYDAATAALIIRDRKQRKQLRSALRVIRGYALEGMKAERVPDKHEQLRRVVIAVDYVLGAAPSTTTTERG